MNIWVVNPFDDLPQEGGRPLRYWSLCRALAERKHTVVWWSSDFSHRTKSYRPGPPEKGIHGPENGGAQPVPSRRDTRLGHSAGFQVRLVHTPPYRDNIGLARLRSHAAFARRWGSDSQAAVAARTLEKPDLLVISLPPLSLPKVAFKLRAKWGCRVVVDIMDAWPETFFRVIPGPLWWKKLLGHSCFLPLFVAARRAYRRADGISAVGRAYLELAKPHNHEVPSQLCFHGISLTAWKARSTPPAATGLQVAYIGAMSDAYDLQTAIRAVAELIDQNQHIVLHLAGGGPKETQLKQMVSICSQNVQDRIHFHGHLQESSLRQLLHSCDVGLIPMRPDSQVAIPYKAGDYAEAGLAMVNSLPGEIHDLIQRYDAGCRYQNGDVNSLQNALLFYLTNPGTLSRHCENSRKLAEECFDAQKIYLDFAAFIEKCKG